MPKVGEINFEINFTVLLPTLLPTVLPTVSELSVTSIGLYQQLNIELNIRNSMPQLGYCGALQPL